MYIYIYIYIYTSMHACMQYIHTCMQYIHTCMHACMHACMHTYMHAYTCGHPDPSQRPMGSNYIIIHNYKTHAHTNTAYMDMYTMS